MPTPRRAPFVCGALGDYSRERVLGAGAASGVACRVVHEDASSILLLDREPLRWTGGRQRGFGWIDGNLWREGAADWEEAARRGACGLVVEGRRRYLHSSASGLGSIYWIEDRGVTYFASRIDPLVETVPGTLSVDWDAWAAIIAMRYPLGERTPFAEIRRLGPSSTLQRRFARTRVRAHRWAWAEIEPQSSLEQGGEAASIALREALEPLNGEIACPLSGGQDSRLLLATLVALGRSSPRALTVSDDEGARFEQEAAEPVARRLGVPWEEIGARLQDYPADWQERAQRVEYQFVDHAWLAPLARRVEAVPGPVLDGFALDTLQQTGAGFHPPEVVFPPNPRAGTGALFDILRQYGLTHEALVPRFRTPLVERARSQFETAARPFEGHPSGPVLALYATRTVRGIANYPCCLLGSGAQVLAPATDNRVAAALLSVSSAEKHGRSMHAAIQAHIAPQLAEMPTTGNTPRTPPTLPRRWRSEPALAMHRRYLSEGPLTPHIAPELSAWLERPEGELSSHLRLGMEAISLFHAWWQRYRNRLREVDPGDLLG
jgi:hypothetical protein